MANDDSADHTDHDGHEAHIETRAIHAGQTPDPETGALMTPIHANSTYAQDAPGEDRGYEYSARGTPPAPISKPTSRPSKGAHTAAPFRAGWGRSTPCSICSKRAITS